VKSALYEGMITHQRHATAATAGVAHSFRYATLMPLLFLDELDDVAALHPRWSRSSPVGAWLRRRDYLGDPSLSLDEAVRRAVDGRVGRRPTGPIAMLAHVRLWGWLFNPLCVYYCYAATSDVVEHVVLEVRSTPWHERHLYVLDAASRHHRFAKEMHVSPFLAMDHDYVMTWSAPSEHLSLHLGNRRGEERLFDASMSLTRREITKESLASYVWRRPLRTMGVSAGIYRQALTLWRKGAHFHPRPLHAGEPESTPHEVSAHG
jgi:DUF1365 family protein